MISAREREGMEGEDEKWEGRERRNTNETQGGKKDTRRNQTGAVTSGLVAGRGAFFALEFLRGFAFDLLFEAPRELVSDGFLEQH